MKNQKLSLSLLLYWSLLLALTFGCSQQAPSPAPLDAAAEQQLALSALVDWSALPVLGRGRHREQSSADRGNRKPPSAVFENGNIDANNFVCHSRDARFDTQQAFAFLFDNPSCAEANVHGVVLARFLGRGRLTRLWLTTSMPDASESLRVYVDDEQSPRFDVPLAGARDGNAGEVFAPPFGAGVGYDLAWYYPLVFSKRLVIALDGLHADTLYFHQSSVVLELPDGAQTDAVVVDAGLLDSAQTDAGSDHSVITSLGATATSLRALQTPTFEGSTELVPASSLRIAAGASVTLAELSGPATIQELRVRLSSANRLRSAALRFTARWDGASEPAIDLPLLELYAAALDTPPNASAALAGRIDADTVELRIRLPMPFARRAQLALVNQGNTEVTVEVAVTGEARVPDSAWGHLYVQRHETLPPAAMATHPLLHARGHGKLVGICVMLEGHALPNDSYAHPMVFLEGDVRGIADGDQVLAGTGTEDYFDSAFYFVGTPAVTPGAQNWGVASAGSSGRASACRWHVLGGSIDFSASIDVSLEVGPGRGDVLDRYRSVAFYYQ